MKDIFRFGKHRFGTVRSTKWRTGWRKLIGIFIVAVWLQALTPCRYVAAASDTVNEIGALIKANQYYLADQRIKECLANNPNDINALLMQGDLILNERLAHNSSSYTVINESIYQKTNGYNQPAPLLIPRSVAVAVAEPWLKCLELDPHRLDIRESLAYLYAQAVMKSELLAILPDLQGEGEKYWLCTLAGVVAERNALNDALELYQAILALYPEEPVVYAGLAEILLQNGRLQEAQQSLTAGAALPGSDKKQLYWTMFKVEATLGNYPQALSALQALAGLTHKRDYQLYQALLSYYNNKPQWSRQMQTFLAAPTDTTDKNNRALARFLLSKANRHDYASYRESIKFKVDSAFRVLLHKRAMIRFPNQVEPVLQYAEFQNVHHNYPEALPILAAAEPRAIVNPSLTETFCFQYAWALQNTADQVKANCYWLKLLNAKDFFVRSAAIYFYGKNMATAGNQGEAVKFFKLIASQAAQSKYAFYCQRMLLQLNKDTQLQPTSPAQVTPEAAAATDDTSSAELRNEHE